MPRTPAARRFAVALAATLLAVPIALALWAELRPWAAAPTIRVDPDAEPEEGVPGRAPLVVDPVAGFRGPRSTTIEFAMAALDAVEPTRVTRRSNNLGFIREDDLPEVLTGPRVLVLGDSHIHGVVPTDQNVGPVLERLLRRRAGFEEALVLNAGCGFYSFYQYVLRARTLVPMYRPRVVVVVAFMGNDFLELENQRVPHLTDDLVEAPTDPDPPPETTGERLAALALPDDFRVRNAFFQGLNQALYLHQHQGRVPVIQHKTRRCLDLLQELAAAHGATLVFALLPSVDLVFPDKIAVASPLTGEVVRGGAQLRYHGWFAAELARRELAFVDLLPVFSADAHLDLYAADLHIWERGHRVLAETLAEPVVQAAR